MKIAPEVGAQLQSASSWQRKSSVAICGGRSYDDSDMSPIVLQTSKDIKQPLLAFEVQSDSPLGHCLPLDTHKCRPFAFNLSLFDHPKCVCHLVSFAVFVVQAPVLATFLVHSGSRMEAIVSLQSLADRLQRCLLAQRSDLGTVGFPCFWCRTFTSRKRLSE